MARKLSFFLLLSLTACTTTKYAEGPDGTVTFSRTSFLNQAKFSKLEKTKDGLKLEGYVNDQVAGAAAITEAAVKGAISGAK